MFSDGLHLTEEGNAVVHKEVVQVLADAHLQVEAMPHDFPHHSKIDGDHPERAFEAIGYNFPRSLGSGTCTFSELP